MDELKIGDHVIFNDKMYTTDRSNIGIIDHFNKATVCVVFNEKRNLRIFLDKKKLIKVKYKLKTS